MRWPLVFRVELRVALAERDMYRALAASRLDEYRQMVDRHMDFVALVADRTAPAPRAVLLPKRESDAADTAILWVAGEDKAKRRYLESYAKAERRAGRDGADIAAAIMAGDRQSDDEDGVPG